MEEYFVNKNAQLNGDHEVHKKNCFYLPRETNRISLGFFSNCSQAVQKAKEIFPTADGCYSCSNECHKR